MIWRDILKKKTLILFTMISLLMLSACSSKDPGKENNNSLTAAELQDSYNELGFDKNFVFSATALDSIEYNNKYFNNSKVTLINFWGTFCGPCIVEMPELEELQQEYDKEEFQVLGIISDTFEGVDTNMDKARKLVKDKNITYLNIIPNENLYENYLKSVQALPTTIFVDEEGNLIGPVVMGARDKDYFKNIIDNLLKEEI